MKVYALVKETYVYWDNDYDCTVKIFVDRESAINFLAIEKESILDEVYYEIKGTLEDANLPPTEKSLEQLYDEGDSNYIYDFTSHDDYFRIYIEEWGSETLHISEQDVMEFKI